MAEKYHVTGNPLDLTTDPSFPKAIGLVEMTGAMDLTLADRRLYNALLANAYETIHLEQEHTIRLSDLRQLSASEGATPHKHNARIKDSLKRLKGQVVEFNALGSDKSDWTHITSLLGDMRFSKAADVLFYEFPKALRPLLADPSLYARIRLGIVYRFQSKYALILYEILQRHASRKRKAWTWEVEVDVLRRLLGLDTQMPNFGDVLRRAIEPAVSDISAHAPFNVTATLQRAGKATKGRGGKVTVVAFHVVRKPAAGAAATEENVPVEMGAAAVPIGAVPVAGDDVPRSDCP